MKRIIVSWLTLAVIVTAGGLTRLCAAEPLNGTLDPEKNDTAERGRPVTYAIELQVAVTAPYKTEKLQVWVPIPPTEHGQELLSSEWSTFPETVAPQIAKEAEFGNQFAYFEFVKPAGAQIIRQRLEIRVWELHWKLDLRHSQPLPHWPAAFDKYRRSESQAVVADARFESLLKEIVPQRQGAGQDLSEVLNWVDHEFTYDHQRASLAGSSVHGLKNRCGHCSDYHGFCAAMGRTLGLPTRIAYGMNTFPKSSPSHCKLECYLPNEGWVSFDVSETQKLEATIRATGTLSAADQVELLQAARTRLLRGFRDNTWFVRTRGTDYDLVPKASQRVPLVRTLYAEADGKPLPEPDPANAENVSFAWMTAHRFVPDRPVKSPFVDVESLRK